MSATPKLAIIGAGMMGAGIAASAALAGNEVALYDVDSTLTARGVGSAQANVRQIVEGGLASDQEGAGASARVHGETDFAAAVDGAFWIIEAITENLALKQALFRKLENEAGRDVILTSNTSGLRISEIVRDVTTRDRTAATHFWFPGHLIPLVVLLLLSDCDRSCLAGAKLPSSCGGIFRDNWPTASCRRSFARRRRS
jgi:3-hydroxybutyryl-CoA dehydrogenase